MKLSRSGVIAVVVAAAFFAGSVVTMAVAGNDGGATVSKKKKAKRGPRGPQGPPGPANIVMRETTSPVVGPGALSPTVNASCQAGEKAVGGGVIWNAAAAQGMRIVESYPANNTPVVTWSGVVENGTVGNQQFRVRVLCAQS